MKPNDQITMIANIITAYQAAGVGQTIERDRQPAIDGALATWSGEVYTIAYGGYPEIMIELIDMELAHDIDIGEPDPQTIGRIIGKLMQLER